MVENPVLFITFVRPEYARKSWDAIKAAQPKTLYFYSNKGRADKEGEIERNEEIRSYIKEIDWDCDLHTWFREETVDVYKSLFGAISWLFENEEQGIILEEDCVASLAFFDYCDQLLPKYKDDYRIWMISGDNYFEDKLEINYDYFFSQSFQIYGWASWRTRWNQIDWDKGIDFNALFDEKVIEANIRNRKCQKAYIKDLNNLRDFIERTRCWDMTFNIYGKLNNALAIVPSSNLVENVGLSGSHSGQEKKGWNNVAVTYSQRSYNTQRYPRFVAPYLQYDIIAFKEQYIKVYGLYYRIIGKTKAIIHSIIN